MNKFVYTKQCQGTVDEVGVRLEQAVRDHEFGVIEVIDLQDRMKQKGVTLRPACRVYEVCNPHQAKVVLEQDMRLSTAMPCRISVYQEGDSVRIATLSPEQTLKLFDVPGLVAVAEEVDESMRAIIDQTAGG